MPYIVPVQLAVWPSFSVHLYTLSVEETGPASSSFVSPSCKVFAAYPVTAYIVGTLLFSVKLLILIFVPFNPY